MAALAAGVCGMDSDLLKIRGQSAAYLARSGGDARTKRDMEAQKEDGSWPGINYGDQSRGHWSPRSHLSRLEQIAHCYAKEDSAYYRNPEALAVILKGLGFWAERDPQSPNWWHPEIGTPQLLCNIILLVGDAMPPELLERLRPILDRSKPGMTGQNKVWLAGIHLMKGVIFNRPAWVEEGRKQIDSELCVAAPGAEGIQSDWSYHQHGPQLQFGNYGLAYFSDMTRWITILAGTRFAFSPEKTEILRNYYENGIRWVLFDEQMDFSACARQNHQRQMFAKYNSAVGTANLLGQALGRRSRVTRNDFRFSGSRYFYDSDFYVQRAPDVYFSVKMCSKRTTGSETVNSENLLGRLTGHGATMMMTENRELEEIGALWNWRQIPGVTSVQDDSPLICKSPGLRNKSEWVGGISGDGVGFCAMDFDNDELTAKKSYFFFGESMVCVGSRISSAKDVPVFTIAAQHRAAKFGPEPGENAAEFIHGNFSFKVLSAPGAEIHAGIREVIGNWQKVTQALSPAPVNGKVFFLHIDHGKRPVNKSYAYSIEYLRKGKLHKQQLLKTSSDAIHAVAQDGTVMAAFYEPGFVTLPDGTGLAVKQPALLMLRNGKLYAADPSQKRKILDIALNNKKFRVELPQDQLAGSTIQVPGERESASPLP